MFQLYQGRQTHTICVPLRAFAAGGRFTGAVISGTAFEAWQLELIAEARRGVLGTVSADGRPHLVPVCYALAEGVFGIAIDEKPKRPGRLARLRNIARDSRVTLLVDRYDDNWRQLAWLRVDGEAAIVERGDERPEMLAALRARYPQYTAMALEGNPLILIVPGHVSAWRWGA